MKILLAEDDLSIQAIAVMALSRVGGHVVSTVKDGLEALEATKKDSYDLILLDIMMPRMNGFDTCARLKTEDTTRGIPVIFLTAKAQMAEVHHGMNLGAVGYILKPFDPMTLHKQIEEVLSNHGKAA